MKITPKAARINAGFTQKMAADELGCNKSTLSNYETGKTFPPMDFAADMAALYGVSLDELNFLQSDTALSGGKEWHGN